MAKKSKFGPHKGEVGKKQLQEVADALLQRKEKPHLSELISPLQALGWPEYPASSVAANYGRALGPMFEQMEGYRTGREGDKGPLYFERYISEGDTDSPPTQDDTASGEGQNPESASTVDPEPQAGADTAPAPKPSGGLITDLADVDPELNTPKKVKEPTLDPETIESLREELHAGKPFVLERWFQVLHGFDDELYPDNQHGRARAKTLLTLAVKHKIVVQDPSRGTYTMILEKPDEAAQREIGELKEETRQLRTRIGELELEVKGALADIEGAAVIRPADLDEIPGDLEVLRVLFDKAREQFFLNLVRLLQTQREVIGQALNAVPPEARDELQQQIALMSLWLDEFFED